VELLYPKIKTEERGGKGGVFTVQESKDNGWLRVINRTSSVISGALELS
jgi:hypothetical protein